MNRHFFILTAFSTVFIASAVLAQQTPRVGYVFPAGGRQGCTFEVRVGGQFLDGVTAAYLSGPGVSVKVVQIIKPMTQQKANQLRDQLKALTDKKTGGAATAKPSGKQGGKTPGKPVAGTGKLIMLSPEEEQMIVDIRKKLARFYGRPPIPAIADTAVLQVTATPDAPPSVRELRLESPAGLTNPLVFQIGRLPEVVNKPLDPEDAPVKIPLKQLRAQGPLSAGTQPTVDIQLPAVVNGQVLSGQVDRYRFTAKKGQHLVVVVSAQQLIPYIANAVPGWFQAAVSLRDEHGAELAYAGSFRFHPDPVLHYEVPHDGTYLIEIHDSVYRGREDFIYRMALGELPYATGIYPLGGPVGTVTQVAVEGWNLPQNSLAVDATRKPAGIELLGGRGTKLPNALPFALDALPECAEQEPNDTPQQAQKLTLPVIVNGHVDHPGDRDVFSFEGKKGQEIVAEVHARRLGSPLDSVLRLSDAAGKQLAFNDDHEDKSCGLITHHADSWLRVALPAAGTYYLELADAQQQGGPEYAYRLYVGPPRPDFDLRIVPSSVSARPGAAVPITVYALRRDGFNGAIDLELKDAPAGFRLSGATVPAGQPKVRLTLSVPQEQGQTPVALHMEGRATIQGKEVRRAAVPADDMMQAYYYRHLVLAQQWMAGFVGRGRAGLVMRPRDAQDVKLPSGGTAVLHFLGPHGPIVKTIQFTLSEPPDGLSLQKYAITDEGLDVTLRADAAKLKPGWKGNVVVEASMERAVESKAAPAKPVKRRFIIGALPATTIEIVKK